MGKVGSKSAAQGGTEDAVSAAQGGTAIRPPPLSKRLDWIPEEKIFIFFHSENQLKKKIVAGKVRLLAPKPTHLVHLIPTNYLNKIR